MKLIPTTTPHIDELIQWFSSEAQVAQWTGPNFVFPFVRESFITMIKWQEIPSYTLVNNDGKVLAFGQFYQRLNCCHLGRLIVNPTLRGQGLGKVLIQQLANKGKATLKLENLSLFVLANNLNALNLYQALGFTLQTYPEDIGLANCLYLIKKPN